MTLEMRRAAWRGVDGRLVEHRAARAASLPPANQPVPERADVAARPAPPRAGGALRARSFDPQS